MISRGVPSTVVTTRVHEPAGLTGETAANLERIRKSTIVSTQTGDLAVHPPENAPPGESEITYALLSENHKLSMVGITMPAGKEPPWEKGIGAVNIFTLWTPNSGATWFLFVGPPGPQGAEGAKGERGIAGPSSIEAMLGISYPLIQGNAKVGSYAAGVALQFNWILVPVPVTCKHCKPIWFPGEIGKGKIRLIIADLGHAAAKTYTPLADTGLYEPKGVKEEPEALPTLERSSGEWTAGELLAVGLAPESAEMRIPLGPTNSANTNAVKMLPEAQEVAGIGAIEHPYYVAHSNATKAQFEAGVFAAIAEASFNPAVSNLAMRFRWS